MRLLLDTHVFLWAVAGNPRLKTSARQLIASASAVHVSAASLWEIAIKVGLGKIDADVHALVAAIDESGFIELPVTARHAVGVHDLPAIHNDPFDRLLIAQARAEPLKLLTVDPILEQYSSDLVVMI
jgi:PIN domain nuclease of toxin-antitoxin system